MEIADLRALHIDFTAMSPAQAPGPRSAAKGAAKGAEAAAKDDEEVAQFGGEDVKYTPQ